MPEVDCHYRENLGEGPGSSGESKWESSVLEGSRAQHKSQGSPMGCVDVYVKVSILHLESHKPCAFF